MVSLRFKELGVELVKSNGVSNPEDYWTTMASMFGRVALSRGFRSLSARRSALLLAGRRNASGSSVGQQLGGLNGVILATGVGVLGVSIYSVSVN